MAEKVFWDAWAFIALASRDARYHAIAKQVVRELDQQRVILVTTAVVLTEVGNTFPKRYLRHYALEQRKFVDVRVKVAMAEVVPIAVDIWNRGWQLYEQRTDKDWGHTDCMSFVVMRELKITKAFTADVHFEQAGFERLVKI